MKRLIIAVLAALICATAVADNELFMVRSKQMFPEAMITLQNEIRKQGYTISRVQRVDIGLTKSGYKTDRYRIVFFGKHREIKELTDRHPELVAYLPLKFSIYAEGQETIIIAANPMIMERIKSNRKLGKIYRRWKEDIKAILKRVKQTAE